MVTFSLAAHQIWFLSLFSWRRCVISQSCSGAGPSVTEHECLASWSLLWQQWARLKLKREHWWGQAKGLCRSRNCRNLFWIYWFQFHTSTLLMPAVSLRSSSPVHVPLRFSSFFPNMLLRSFRAPLIPASLLHTFSSSTTLLVVIPVLTCWFFSYFVILQSDIIGSPFFRLKVDFTPSLIMLP